MVTTDQPTDRTTEKPGRRRQRRRTPIAIATALLAALALLVFTGAPADAATVTGTTLTGYPATVQVETGPKDFNNHTEFIGRVQAWQSEGWGGNGSQTGIVPGKYEIWGEGFYYETTSDNGISIEVDRWVPSGTHVCMRSPLGAVACIDISV